MKKIPISFDLDNTVFDVSDLYLDAWRVSRQRKPAKTKGYPTRWDFYNDPSFPKAVSDYLLKSFLDGALLRYTCSEALAEQLNAIINNPAYDVFFVTDRPDELDSYGQLLRNHIKVAESHVIISHEKHKTLAELGIQIHCDDNPLLMERLTPHFRGTLPVLMSNATTLYNHYVRNRKLDFGQQSIPVPMYPDLLHALADFGTIVDTLMRCLDYEKRAPKKKMARGKKS